jgi:hypothetical protein
MSTGEERGRFLPLDVSPEWREKKALERGEVVLSPLGTATIYPSQVPYWRNPFEADPPQAGGKVVLDFSQAEVARARNELALMLAGQPPEDVDCLRLAGGASTRTTSAGTRPPRRYFETTNPRRPTNGPEAPIHLPPARG